MKKKLLYIPIFLSLLWVGADINQPPMTGDWLAFIIGEICLQILIKDEYITK